MRNEAQTSASVRHKVSPNAMIYMFHHLFLPPKLPQSNDFDPQHERSLVDVTCSAIQMFKAGTGHEHRDAIESASDMLEALRSVRDESGAVNELKLGVALLELSERGGTIPLHLGAQNAGLIVSKLGKDICFEAFELSPLNEPVITTKGRLLRSFPGCATAVTQETFNEEGFQETLAQTVAKMSHQAAPNMHPKVRKAGQQHSEMRDTSKPSMVTEHLMSFMRAAGKTVGVSTIQKSTREEVLWLDSKEPWRRSSLWLLIRVALQLRFARSAALAGSSSDLYKPFMVFFLARILHLSRFDGLPSDILSCMNSKLCQRLGKVDGNMMKPWSNTVADIMTSAHSVIESAWQGLVMESPDLDLECLDSIDFKRDTAIDLKDLDDYIIAMLDREETSGLGDFQPTCSLPRWPPNDLPSGLDGVEGEYQAFGLAALEDWVEHKLSNWLGHHISEGITCARLRILIQRYHNSAAPYYANHPEGYSSMLLTLTELWVACDKSACVLFGMLSDYPPEIPVEVLQSLLLPFKSQMRRLSAIEQYLKDRQTKARENPIIYSFGRSATFSVRYFDQSLYHQDLLSEILVEASREREEKCIELSQKKDLYQRLMILYDENVCDLCEIIIDSFNDFRETRHSSNCRRCGYKKSADSISIYVHEWPLPSDTDAMKSTVFELEPPPAFCQWRDATTYFLIDILGSQYTEYECPRAKHTLENYQGLRSFCESSRLGSQRIGLLSQVKPHTGTHRNTKHIVNVTEPDVCLNNGLRFQYYDSTKGVFCSTIRTTDMVSDLCTYQLPKRSIALQKFLARPPSMPNGLLPNHVIGSQSDCPSFMSLHEYKALSALPLGYRIQWQNILVQLAIPSVNFSETETTIFLLQIAHQAGLAGEDENRRASHADLGDEVFGQTLLNQLRYAKDRMKENWDAYQALASFITLCTRLLSLACSPMIQEECLRYLAEARETAFGWMNLLQEKVQQSHEEAHRIELSSVAVNIALISTDTFYVDQVYLERILSSSAEASILLQSSIFIQEQSRSMRGHSHPLHPILIARWKLLCFRALPIFISEILARGSLCLDVAIKRSWSEYEARSPWTCVATPHEHWLTAETGSWRGSQPLSVQFNLLTAELLVNGLPLARLPSHYESHPSYSTLFGRTILEVMPAGVPDMEFSAKKRYADHSLQFAMHGSDLVLHATRGNQSYDLLPSRIFCGKFPNDFVDKYVHWYNHADGTIEFRPVQAPWTSSPAVWRLMKADSSWCLSRSDVALISVSSETTQALSRILRPFEKLLNINVYFHVASQSIEIDLPRLQLGFDLRHGSSQIYSRQFRGMSIDPDQRLGTLIGLRNKLVLKRGHDRVVTIPEGQVTYQQTSAHISVSIDLNPAARVHAYSIDRRLGRLVDDGSMQSKLFISYLHGLTSHCLPDPLTRYTGTEQALAILDSAAVRSFDYLRENHITLLKRIAKLAPERKYYPANERSMQTIHWDSNLSFLSQHGRLYKTVQAIFEQANETRFFYPDRSIELPKLDTVVPHLLERDLIRSSTFRVADFGAEQFSGDHDVVYPGRDRGQDSQRATRSFIVASLVFQGQPVLHHEAPHGLKDELWQLLQASGTVPGPVRMLDDAALKYDSKWLDDPSRYLGSVWCQIHMSFRHSPHGLNKFRIMQWLSTMAFAEHAAILAIHTLTAFYNLPEVAQIEVPSVARFQLSEGAGISLPELKVIVRSKCRPFTGSAEASLPKMMGESKQQVKERRQRVFRSSQGGAIQRFASALHIQWPCESPESPSGHEFSTYLAEEQIMTKVRSLFRCRYENLLFQEYLGLIERTLQSQRIVSIPTPVHARSPPILAHVTRNRFVSVDDVFAGTAPTMHFRSPTSPEFRLCVPTGNTQAGHRLETILADCEARASMKCQVDYYEALRESVLALRRREMNTPLDLRGSNVAQVLQQYRADCHQHVEGLYSAMTDAAEGPHLGLHGLGAIIRHWPRISPKFFLQQLNRNRWKKLRDSWKDCLLSYALALSELQRAERLFCLSRDPTDLSAELLNVGHRNWKISEFPETLLLEVESGIMVREVQEDIACQMRNPPSNENATMQLNMGEGKSTVIVPIVTAFLADGTYLVRVVVAKPQSKQMFQMLVSKLGGLLGRRIYHMPFSRDLKLNGLQADSIGKISRDCIVNRGILLVQPEHILSFKLMGLECLITGRESIGRSLLQTQHFSDTQSRDIVDESDENFSVKFELIYTMGMQRPIELGSERWTIIQHVLGLIFRFAPEVKCRFPLSIEVDDRWSERIPRIRFLRSDAQELILKIIADHICTHGFPGFPIARQSEDTRLAIQKYIIQSELTMQEAAKVEQTGPDGFWTESTKKPLLLLRGLIAGGVLSFVFSSKRWRVNYGLDVQRLPMTKLAVPFRAKDSPTPRSEFSHPDVVLVLTLLCHYYGGLHEDDLFAAFSHLLQSDQNEVNYGEWVRGAPNIPDGFRQSVGINIKDRSQFIEKVFPHLRYSKGAIDYFLSYLVFPKVMKEFPDKISASGWDIGQVKTHPTTGFSGTNDSRHVLPLAVHHLDLPRQKHTNALVLDYLLQDEHQVTPLTCGDGSTKSDAELLLTVVIGIEPAVRVILDVGAQILELNNLQVAKAWLDMSPDQEKAKAVVFFDISDELSVLDRKGHIEPLQISPYAKQLDLCLVYLDETHTRGTDLNLPRDYRAAVTLGANLTKDRLVQACMRMRKLGHGQSVVFCVPEEINRKIHECTRKPDSVAVEVADILIWVFDETCVDLRRSMLLWAAQGRRHEYQKLLWTAARCEHGLDFSKAEAEKFLEEEAQTLDRRYRPQASQTPPSSGWNLESKNMSQITARCQDFASTDRDQATLQEEQERELSPEIEQECEIERAAPAEPEPHFIHHDVIMLVRTGKLKTDSEAYLPAFEALRSTSAAAYFEVSQFTRNLFVTTDFARTIKFSGRNYVSDTYQRPVQWILSIASEHSKNVEYMVVFSPFEAQEMRPLIKAGLRVTLHLYAPRPNSEFRSLDTLDLFTEGREFESSDLFRELAVQLNLFAGQLYLTSFAEYIETCSFLGLAWKAAERGTLVEADGFILSGPGQKGFNRSPVKFLKILMTKIRRNCEGIEKTHLGKVLEGSLLEGTDFHH